jgi:Ni/Co efflux regulator RcnB
LRRFGFRLLVCVLALMIAGQASARQGDGAEREQRRMELRQQLQGERDRWQADPRRNEGHPGRQGGGRGEAGMPHHGGHGGAKLSPDERRALHRDLRDQRP